jgi:hypothetical protein
MYVIWASSSTQPFVRCKYQSITGKTHTFYISIYYIVEANRVLWVGQWYPYAPVEQGTYFPFEVDHNQSFQPMAPMTRGNAVPPTEPNSEWVRLNITTTCCEDGGWGSGGEVSTCAEGALLLRRWVYIKEAGQPNLNLHNYEEADWSSQFLDVARCPYVFSLAFLWPTAPPQFNPSVSFLMSLLYRLMLITRLESALSTVAQTLSNLRRKDTPMVVCCCCPTTLS